MPTSTENRESSTQEVMHDPSRSSAGKYAELAVGDDSVIHLIVYECLTLLLSGMPGALGYALRRLFYPLLFASMGRDVTIGRHVTLRGGRKIHLGDGVTIDDDCVLDARGATGSIRLHNNVLLARSTIVRARDGALVVGEGSDIGSRCILGTDSRLEIGENVLLAAFTYLVAGGSHNFTDPDVPVIQQGCTSKGGIRVGDGAWLGARVTVLDGVTIGENAIVGAHALVTRDLPSGTISHGSPANVVRHR